MLKRFLPFLPIVLLIACFPPTEGVDPSASTAVIQTITATMWTLTPSVTPEPNTGKIVGILNSAIMDGSDPLANTIGAKFSVIDAQFINEPPANVAGTLSIHVECEWVYSDCCTSEETFVVLMHALTANDKSFAKITEQIPVTIHTMQVVTFDRMIQTGMIIVSWTDVVDYATGKINGSQLGSRIIRFAAP